MLTGVVCVMRIRDSTPDLSVWFDDIANVVLVQLVQNPGLQQASDVIRDDDAVWCVLWQEPRHVVLI